MKSFKLLISIGLLALPIALLAAPQRVEGEVLVKFKPAYRAVGGAVHQRIGARVTGGVPRLGYVKVTLPFGIRTDSGISYYRNHPYVEAAQQNGIKYGMFEPNDPEYKNQWHYPMIKLPEAWNIVKGSQNIIVAVLDTGVDKDHPDLASKLVPGRDFANNDNDPDDDQGHGTHCAGTVGAATNNGVGVAGVGFNCRIMPIKVLAAAGFGTDEWITNGMIFAADNGAHILSMSLGGFGTSPLEAQTVQYVTSKGKLIIAAAGNHGSQQKAYPAAYPQTVAVAATDINDRRAGFSAFGKDWVDVAAPGDGILSTTIGGGYGLNSGTSMACPHVAGLAALVWSVYGVNGKAIDVRRQIEQNCDNPFDIRNEVAFGRVNALRAIPSIALPEVKYAAISVSKLEGGASSGSLANVTASENTYFSLASTTVARTGQVASTRFTFGVPTNPTAMNTFYIKFEGFAMAGVNVVVFAKDYQTGAWVYVNAQPSGNTDATRTVTMSPTQVARYINPTTKRMEVLLRAVASDTLYKPAPAFTSRWDLVHAGSFLKPTF